VTFGTLSAGSSVIKLPAVDSFIFSCESAARLALWLFSAIGALVGFAVYAVLYYAQHRRPGFTPLRAIKRGPAAAVGGAVALLIVGSVYFTSLAGFYRLAVHQNSIELKYILPERKVMVAKSDIVRLTRVPAYKSRWYLRLETRSGAIISSAPAIEYQVFIAWNELNSMGIGHGTQQPKQAAKDESRLTSPSKFPE
jgi:hypothetical protein